MEEATNGLLHGLCGGAVHPGRHVRGAMAPRMRRFRAHHWLACGTETSGPHHNYHGGTRDPGRPDTEPAYCKFVAAERTICRLCTGRRAAVVFHVECLLGDLPGSAPLPLAH